MRVLFQSYYDFGRMYGGGPSVVYSLMKELRKLGVEIHLHDYWNDDPRDFDVTHYFSCYDSYNWLRHRDSDPPLVVTPFSWYDFGWKRRLEKTLKFTVGALRHRTLDRARLGDPFAVPARFFPNCEGEAKHFTRWCRVPRTRTEIIPHGVDRSVECADEGLFKRKYGLKDFALCVGRFEAPRKNQLTLVRALKQESVPLVFIGGPEPGHENYYERCRAEAGKNTHFLGPLQRDDPLLASAFHACKVVVMPGVLESPGLTGMEGALAGANLAVTTGGSTREHFVDLAWYFDPFQQREMRSAILQALEAPRQYALQDRVRKLYTWDQIVRRQLDAYKRVMESRHEACSA